MADPRSIHEFTTGQVEATTLLLGDFVDLDAQSGYTTLKMSVSDLGEVLLEDIEYTQELQTADKTIVGAINENKSVIGYSYDEYDATTAYSTGDLCIYNNVLYKAKQATTGNLPTNTSYWDATSIADEIGRIDSEMAMGAETPISTTAPFVEYRVCGHLLFVQINTWDHAISSDETLGYIPNTITILMQGRQYTPTGLIAIDKSNGRIWARNLATYSSFLFVLPIA